MSNIEGEKYIQLPLELPSQKPNQFNNEPVSDPLTVFAPEKGDEGEITEEYKGLSEEEQDDTTVGNQSEKPANIPKSDQQITNNGSWVYDSKRRGAQAYAARGRSNPADND